jgi:hypothetical protein
MQSKADDFFPKHFLEGAKANEHINFYIAPEIKDLGQKLINGHYIFVEGYRQSGKMTSIIATANYVQKK